MLASEVQNEMVACAGPVGWLADWLVNVAYRP